jgi:hypothetical protein
MSASFVAALETVTLVLLLRRRFGQFGEAKVALAGSKMALSGLIMTAAVYELITNYLPLYATDKGFVTLAPKFGLILVVASASYLLPALVLRLNEAHLFIARLRDALTRTINLT